MNTPTPYENLIAAKLDQIPVPDMADSIWANIEMQLDADLDIDDNKPSDNPGSVKPGMGKGFYFSILSAIIIALVIIYKENKKTKNKNNILPVIPKTETVVPVADSSQSIKDPVQKNSTAIPQSSNIKDTTANPFNPGNRIIFDSLAHQAIPQAQPDSSQPLLKNKIAPPSLDSLTLPPINKPKGVKGINDDDYKIKTGKKDTTKRGG
ncbi:hypothetical protein [Ferruginibacter sp. SUN106]|uniref:hypothetical protein n=1 Tax=Ferruginibacter sp. SUN106 TaxID=2978348 RepID=UPI003D368BAE